MLRGSGMLAKLADRGNVCETSARCSVVFCVIRLQQLLKPVGFAAASSCVLVSSPSIVDGCKSSYNRLYLYYLVLASSTAVVLYSFRYRTVHVKYSVYL
jgi:hypothetical protein